MFYLVFAVIALVFSALGCAVADKRAEKIMYGIFVLISAINFLMALSVLAGFQ